MFYSLCFFPEHFPLILLFDYFILDSNIGIKSQKQMLPKKAKYYKI